MANPMPTLRTTHLHDQQLDGRPDLDLRQPPRARALAQ